MRWAYSWIDFAPKPSSSSSIAVLPNAEIRATSPGRRAVPRKPSRFLSALLARGRSPARGKPAGRLATPPMPAPRSCRHFARMRAASHRGKARGARRSRPAKGKSHMFRFTLTGRIGRIEQVKGDAAIIRISLAADRLVEGKDGAWTKTEWVSAVSFDETLNRELLTALAIGHLQVGMAVTLDGRIEPRKRQVGETTITDHSFVLTKCERVSTPAQTSVGKAAATAA